MFDKIAEHIKKSGLETESMDRPHIEFDVHSIQDGDRLTYGCYSLYIAYDTVVGNATIISDIEGERVTPHPADYEVLKERLIAFENNLKEVLAPVAKIETDMYSL